MLYSCFPVSRRVAMRRSEGIPSLVASLGLVPGADLQVLEFVLGSGECCSTCSSTTIPNNRQSKQKLLHEQLPAHVLGASVGAPMGGLDVLAARAAAAGTPDLVQFYSRDRPRGLLEAEIELLCSFSLKNPNSVF